MNNKPSAKLESFDEAFHLQAQTIETLRNINEDLSETEQVGGLSLESLKREKYKLNDILEESDRLSRAHDKTRRLQNRLGRWTMTFGGQSRDSAVTKKVSSKAGKSRNRVDASSQVHSSLNRSNITSKHDTAHYKNNPKDYYAFDTGICSADSILRETHADEVTELDENDKEIERMLNETSSILARIETISSQAAHEIASSGEDLETIERRLEAAESSQQRINARSLDFLSGVFLHRGINAKGRDSR